MFSLKHRERGIETLKSVESVTFDEAKNQLVGHGVEGDLKYTSGVVFVSNENGQTVGIYHLTKR